MISPMDLSSERMIMEIGCGTGENAYLLAQKTGQRVLGIDLCGPFIEQAQQRHRLPNLEFQVMDFNQPDSLSDREFDYIVGNGILHHLYYKLDEALVNIRRLLKPDGTLLFFEPNIYNPYCTLIFKVPVLREKARLEPTEMAFSRRFIQRKLLRAGFKDISVNYKDFLIPGVADVMINPLIMLGNIAEKTPLLKVTAQSLFIKARK